MDVGRRLSAGRRHPCPQRPIDFGIRVATGSRVGMGPAVAFSGPGISGAVDNRAPNLSQTLPGWPDFAANSASSGQIRAPQLSSWKGFGALRTRIDNGE